MALTKTTVTDLPWTKDASLCGISILFGYAQNLEKDTQNTTWRCEANESNQPFLYLLVIIISLSSIYYYIVRNLHIRKKCIGSYTSKCCCSQMQITNAVPSLRKEYESSFTWLFSLGKK